SMRAEFPNPDQILLPGMYLRVRVPQGVDEKALKVPQQAVQRTADGLSSLVVVREGKAQTVPVSTGMLDKGQMIITKGLKAGDMVVVEGFQKIRPGAPVQTIPWNPNAQGAPAKEGAPEKPADAKPAAKPAEQG